jgi:hypothetical protein
LKRDRPGDLGKGERQHGEIDAGESHREPPEDESAGERQQRAGEQGKPHGQTQRLRRKRCAVAAEPEIGGMAERGEPADRHQQLQALRE